MKSEAPAMNSATATVLRDQLLDRRERLKGAVAEVGEAEDLVHLLHAVDSALERMDTRSYGECLACHESVEDSFLLENPLVRWCLCDLSDEQQRALEKDIGLASRLQWELLPAQDIAFAGWQVHFRYLPAGPVSGDYCDVVTRKGGNHLYALLGDVSGKGVAASFLMARLNALLRNLVDSGLPLEQIVARANQQFSEGTPASHYATLVCAKADAAGGIEICNAGHCQPLVVRAEGVRAVEESGLPVGMFDGSPYTVAGTELEPGDSLFLYTDGLVEAENRRGAEYGVDRLAALLKEHRNASPNALAEACLRDVAAVQAGAPRRDDLTLMILRRAGDVSLEGD
jgi:sigma-B regulation protein RsbU (phosphoserine phosphatase)